MDPRATAEAIGAELDSLPVKNTPAIRAVRRRWSKALSAESGEGVYAAALELHRLGRRWVAEELIRNHRAAFALIDEPRIEELARGLDSWWSVDGFATILAGPAWARGQITDALIWHWARSPDRWLRRSALVCTTALDHKRSDTERTLALCAALAGDRDDMVEKALSWALRVLSSKDRAAVEAFVDEHVEVLAARVKREVGNKLRTGLKNPKSPKEGARA